MLSPELAERSSRKNVIANQYEWTTFGREVTRRSRPTNIQDLNRTSDGIVAERNRFSARGSFAKMRQKFDASTRCSTGSTPSKCVTQEVRCRKSEALARNSHTDLYELSQWPVPRFVNVPISIFRAGSRIFPDYSAALNAAQR
jgi:hypothetical protein